MARAKNIKPTLEQVVFATPEQKLLNLLLHESTTTFTLRTLSSKLKGVRGLGGAEGIHKILEQMAELDLILFKNNNRSVCLNNDSSAVQYLKRMAAICDLENLRELLKDLSTRGVLFGSRASGLSQSDSDYNLLVVSDETDEVTRIVSSHPIGKQISLLVRSAEEYRSLPSKEAELAEKIEKGIVLWGRTW